MSEIQESGPFRPYCDDNGRLIGLISDDFHHDAALEISGDFEDEDTKRAYIEEIARRLNGYAPEPDEARVERVATTLALYGVWPDEAKKVARAAIRAMEER